MSVLDTDEVLSTITIGGSTSVQPVHACGRGALLRCESGDPAQVDVPIDFPISRRVFLVHANPVRLGCTAFRKCWIKAQLQDLQG
jgi:hypothetical protein